MRTLNLTIPGFTIACKLWGNPNNPPIIALHGWLDNANSFDYLADYMSEEFYFIAVDLPGHGHSSHFPAGCYFHYTDALFTLMRIINALKLDKVHLLGHSMGAGLSSLAAGVAPERFLSLTLIEGLGPFSYPEETACKQLSAYLDNLAKEDIQSSKGYNKLKDAALARSLKGYVSFEIAKTLSERALIEKDGMYHWRHDRRLLSPTPLRMTEEQILSCLREIQAKTYLLWASDGFKLDSIDIQVRINAIKNLKIERLEGGHHIHMEQPETVSKLLIDFYYSI